MERLVDVAWAAGLIEGEGCFTWNKSQAKRYGHARVCVDQVDKEPIQKLFNVFGGNILGPYKTTHKPRYRWEVNGARAVAIMEELYPFMSRRRRAKITENIWRHSNRPKPGGDRRSQIARRVQFDA